jgi:hypothetical protein
MHTSAAHYTFTEIDSLMHATTYIKSSERIHSINKWMQSLI